MSSSMENYQGDLADIIRATTGSTNSDELLPLALTDTWQFNHPDPMNFSTDDFGHPFSYSLEDPFLHDLNISGGTASGFFSGSSSGSAVNTREFGDGMKNNLSNKIVDEKMKINILSPLIAPTLASNDIITTNNTSVHMSSPRNMGTKRRKSPAKKVVSIPAPAPPNSRPTGEIVPSDLWAWRKYGQKPIKGSPYPRGYYRCSSSKGCSARKQVERSKTEPNMLVITYTSDHNHPWPTQRNALAGSTRAQLPKNNSAPNISSPKMKDEQKENNKDSVATQITCTPPVKEERKELNKDCFEDFFADLGEIDGDPLNLFFTRGFSPGEERENSKHKVLDPFNFCEWTGSSSINNTSCDEAKEGFLTRP